MAVRKLKSGKWIADVVVGVKWDGTPDRRSETCNTKKKAEKAERMFLLEKERRKGVSGRITFSEFLEYVYWPQKSGLRPNTKRGYERDIRLRLEPAFGQIPIEHINKLRIQTMINSCQTRKVATNARDTLSSILSVALEMGMIDVNPAGFTYRYPEKGIRAETADGVWLTSFDEHVRLLEYLKEHHPGEAVERIVVLGLCFGFRKGEILGMDFESIDLGRMEADVMQTYVTADGGPYLSKPKTEKSIRTVPVLEWAADRLRAWDYRAEDIDLMGHRCHPVVGNRYGKRLSPVVAANAVRRLRGESYDDGTPLPAVTMMSLRHSFATSCIRAGIDVASVSKWLGHQQVSTTYNMYVKPLLSNLHEDANAIDDLYKCNSMQMK